MAIVSKPDAASKVAGSVRKPTREEVSNLVARLRHRGMTNPMLNEPGQAFEKANPGWKCKWIFSPPDSKDQSDVMLYSSIGFRLVTQDEIPSTVPLPHTQEKGPVRVADVVLMAAPTELFEAIEAEELRIAREDASLPVEEYKRTLAEKSSAGKVKGMALGDVEFTTSDVQANLERLSAAAEAEGT